MGKSRVSLAVDPQPGDLSDHSLLTPFLHRRYPQLPLSLRCAASWAKAMLVKSLLSTLMHPNLYIFFAPVECWNFCRNRDFYEGFLICECLPKSVFSRSCGQERVESVRRLLLVPQPLPGSVWLVPEALVGETPPGSLGIWCWIS